MSAMNWLVTYPELMLLVAACGVLLADVLFADDQHRLTHALTQAVMAAFAALHAWALVQGLGGAVGETVSHHGMQGMLVADPMGHLLACAAALAMMATLAYAQVYIGARELRKGELYVLSLFALLGMAVMIGANHFVALYVGLELMSLSLYALVALRRDHGVATEAAMKYFVLGALASGFLLYGLSMMYGATGSLAIPEVFRAIEMGQGSRLVLTLGCVFVMAGLAFKLGLVPFHMWVPDVYQGAPTAITLMVAGAPKLAAFAITMRLLVEAFGGIAADWQQMVIALAVLSMTVGNIAAIVQRNFKRMLAYSGIAQLGFMLLGFAPVVMDANPMSAANGYSSALFYVLTYVLTTLGTLGMVMLMARQGFECDEIDDLAGLAKRAPWLAAVMTILMFSLAGIPPMVGFYAKFAILQALVSTNLAGYVVLAVVAVLLSLIGAYYYLRVVKVMYFDAPSNQPAVSAGGGTSLLLAANGAAVLLLGVVPQGLMALCRDAVVATVTG